MQAERIADALGGRKTGNGWSARCPAHQDGTPSLVINVLDGKVLFKCHAGCTQEAVLNALKIRGLWATPEEESILEQTGQWVYSDGNGYERLRVTRKENAFGKKTFLQEHKKGHGWVFGRGSGPIAPYKYEKEWVDEEFVFLVEGEKCADILRSVGLKATTTPGGANGWRVDFGKFFSEVTVIILPDNDRPGRQYAQSAYADLVSIAHSVVIVDLPKLAESEDVYDWIKVHGGTKDSLLEIIRGEKPKTPIESAGFESAAEGLDYIETLQRMNREGCIPFGIRFFDEAMGGILPTDLIVLTARTGYGKTQCVMNIAKEAILKGKRVCFFALEAFKKEIETRMIYTIAAHEAIESGQPIPYLSWGAFVRGDREVCDALKWFVDGAKETLRENFKNLFTYYRDEKAFDVNAFEKKFQIISKESDLVIIDHLNYFDSHREKPENQISTEIMKRVRDAGLYSAKPIIMVVHLRKKDFHDKKILSDIDDIHGSSDIVKIPTKVIVLGKSLEHVSRDWRNQATFARVLKDRFGDNNTIHTALLNYSVPRGKYDDEYSVGRLVKGDTEFEPLNFGDYPKWYKPKKPTL